MRNGGEELAGHDLVALRRRQQEPLESRSLPLAAETVRADDQAHEDGDNHRDLEQLVHHFLRGNQTQGAVLRHHVRIDGDHDGVGDDEIQRSSADPQVAEFLSEHDPPRGRR
jgi:hypothetical protein